MCGITGWIDWKQDLTQHAETIERMTEKMTPRGPDAAGTWISQNCALGHRRLSVIDPDNGAQPMYRKQGDHIFAIAYNGEIYNAAELRNELKQRGHSFDTMCDTEVVLCAYMEWGSASVERLNGIFAYVIWQSKRQTLFAARDRVGVKPLFYSASDQGRLLFGSEPKSILIHPQFSPEIDADGLAEIFVIGPARTPGHGIYCDMHELKPGHCFEYSRDGLKIKPYWKLESAPHEHDTQTTAEHIRDLLQDTVERQLISDVPICTMLSGGLDSSALTAFATIDYQQKQRGQIDTFSVDYIDNDQHFTENEFQPNADRPWIIKMSRHLNTHHHFIDFDTPELVEALDEVVYARDLPGMADVDASLYLFCREIKKNATVALSGEAADEIFGGYPWFHRQSALESNTFPWSLHTETRANLLSPELNEHLDAHTYILNRYQEALDEVPHLSGETEHQRKMRQMSYLNITRFMPTLLDRKDRMSMRVGLEVRVPFCDHRLIEYVWNIPWEIKTAGNREKGILRKALQDVLPRDIIQRKKSPYPKTHNPGYLKAVKGKMLDVLNDKSSPILPFIDTKQIRKLASSEQDSFQVPWFGQLMTGPQLFAYLYQVNLWLKTYNVRIR